MGRMLMISLMLAPVVAVSACAPVGAGKQAVAREIERQVRSRHPDVPLERFARFYSFASDTVVRGVYVFANEGYEPIVGQVGEVKWTTLAGLPAISDGGCTVLNVEYDTAIGQLRTVECNGPGEE